MSSGILKIQLAAKMMAFLCTLDEKQWKQYTDNYFWQYLELWQLVILLHSLTYPSFSDIIEFHYNYGVYSANIFLRSQNETGAKPPVHGFLNYG